MKGRRAARCGADDGAPDVGVRTPRFAADACGFERKM